MPVRAKELLDQTREALNFAEDSERNALAFGLLEDLFGLSKVAIILNEKLEIDPELWRQSISRLNAREPLQQVVGFGWFRGRKFKVSQNTLIPRPETEELIDHVSELKIPAPKILDIGTGSGCIAISLALEIPKAKVLGLDISEKALEIAHTNNLQLQAGIDLLQADILQKNFIPPGGPFDVIVSNPPYIRKSEMAEMEPNVLNYEPHLALFVKDDEPLLFYQAIAECSLACLKTGGTLLVEINSYLGSETRQLFEGYGFIEVCLLQDFYQRDRFVKAKKP